MKIEAVDSSTIVFLWSLTTVHPLPRQAPAHRLWNLLGHLEIHHAEKARQLRLRGDSCRGGNRCQIGRSWVGSWMGGGGETRERPSQARWSPGVTVLRIPGPPSPTRNGELEPSPATQAPTYGVQRSLNSLAMVSMPPARATAM